MPLPSCGIMPLLAPNLFLQEQFMLLHHKKQLVVREAALASLITVSPMVRVLRQNVGDISLISPLIC